MKDVFMLGTIKVYFLFPPVNFAKSCVKLKKNKKQKMQVTKRQKQKKKKSIENASKRAPRRRIEEKLKTSQRVKV